MILLVSFLNFQIVRVYLWGYGVTAPIYIFDNITTNLSVLPQSKEDCLWYSTTLLTSSIFPEEIHHELYLIF